MAYSDDSTDYKAEKSDYGDDDSNGDGELGGRGGDDMASVPVTEEIPVSMSKNNVGNRFVAFIFDRDLATNYDVENDPDSLWEMHKDRIALTEDHVMWARKQNLYNETFNTESMADIIWSQQLLSTDLQRTVGHAMCIDSPSLEHCREALSRDPIIRSILGVDDDGHCDVSPVALYRWRHIRDHTLRIDDGRYGVPNILLAMDRPGTEAAAVRAGTSNDHLEYLIRSERVIAAGPLHVATEDKADEDSVAVGTLMMVNGKNRDDAVKFVEKDPAAMAGLYETMRVHRFNSLDVTGKFVSENLYFPKQNTYQMKEAMEYWGYPVDDDQTKWVNW